MAVRSAVLVFVVTLLVAYTFGQSAPQATSQPTDAGTQAVYCTFQDGVSMRVNYVPVNAKGRKVIGDVMHIGKVWAPDNKAALLASDASLDAGGTQIKPGLYGLYLIPDRDNWTVVLSSRADTLSQYKKVNDVARIPAQVFPLSSKDEQLQIALVHAAPTQCNLRIYWGENVAIAEFKQVK